MLLGKTFSSKSLATSRLYPLYAATFLQNLAFWYAIEKVFMRSLGMDNRQIALATIVFTAITLIFSIPFGIYADRHSRKNMLVFSSICLVLATYICGSSTSFLQYVIGLSFWGLFSAAYAGIYESLIYEVLIEDQGNSENYEKTYGTLEVFNTIALIIGALVGGLAAKYLGLSSTYYLYIPFAVVSILPIVFFNEPKIHKQSQVEFLLTHVKESFLTIIKTKSAIYLAIIIGILVISTRILFEFGPLWFVVLSLPVVLFGPAISILHAIAGISGYFANYIKKTKHGVVIIMYIALVLILLLGLRNIVSAIIAISTLLLVFYSLNILFTNRFHSIISSNLRVSALSVISTISLLIFIPIAYLFGYISDRYSIFTASWILGVLIACLIIIFKGKYPENVK